MSETKEKIDYKKIVKLFLRNLKKENGKSVYELGDINYALGKDNVKYIITDGTIFSSNADCFSNVKVVVIPRNAEQRGTIHCLGGVVAILKR